VPETKESDKAKISVRSLLLHESGIISFIPYYTTAIDPKSYEGSLFGPRSNIYNVHYAGAWARTDYHFLPELISHEPSEEFYLPVARDLYASDKMHDALLRDIIASPLQKKGKIHLQLPQFHVAEGSGGTNHRNRSRHICQRSVLPEIGRYYDYVSALEISSPGTNSPD